MRREQLHPHPSLPVATLRELSVDIDWRGALALNYRLTGDISALCIPAHAAAQRCDELWRHTCCELFIAVPEGAGYYEFNFSPASHWAAYHFDSYRSGMRAFDIPAPMIITRATAAQLDVQVEIDLGSIATLQAAGELRCALSAVVEEISGARSFWALRHATAQPDFHHPDSFDLRLQLGR